MITRFLPLILVFMACQPTPSMRFEQANNRIDLIYGEQLITSYLLVDSLQKQPFYPIYSGDGTLFTRANPLQNVEGESVDHPHHIGMWFAYGEVNGIDFWTSTWETYDGVNPRHGKIVPISQIYQIDEPEKASFHAQASWIDVDGNEHLQQIMDTDFIVSGNELIIDNEFKLIARRLVRFEDTKEGMFALRVPDFLREDHTGQYINAEGLIGEEEVWGQQSKWVALRSNSRQATAAILDHEDNLPAYWMTRGYGLFSVDPLGKSVFEGSTDSLNLVLQKGEHISFKYRTVLSDRYLDTDQINQLYQSFQ